MNKYYIEILQKIMTDGEEVTAGESLSIGSNRNFYEILNFSHCFDNIQNNLPISNIQTFNLYLAIGRLLWLLRGSNSLSEICYYDSNVKYFSDDGKTIPGSSFGNKIFNYNQLDKIIEKLKSDKSSRRCVIPIFEINDNLRDSKDIPCLLYIAYHIRKSKLITTISMRSNNALKLFLYNFFELTTLSKIIANNLNIEIGNVYYNSLSMHIYSDDLKLANDIIENELNKNKAHKEKMEYEQNFQFKNFIETLNILQDKENLIRTNDVYFIFKDFKENFNTLKEKLEIWFDFYLILMHFRFKKENKKDMQLEIEKYLSKNYQKLLQ